MVGPRASAVGPTQTLRRSRPRARGSAPPQSCAPTAPAARAAATTLSWSGRAMHRRRRRHPQRHPQRRPRARCRRPGPRTPRSRPSRLTRRAPPARWSRRGRLRQTNSPLSRPMPRRCQTAHHRPTRLPLSRIMRIRLHLRRPKRDGARRRRMRPCSKDWSATLGPSRQAGCGATSATCTATAGVIVHHRRRHYLGPTRPTKKILEFNAGPRRSARPAYPFLCVTPCCVFLRRVSISLTQ